MITKPMLALAALLASLALPARADDPPWRHATSLLGPPKYPADFRHFDYVDPEAPKGGRLRIGVLGTFDSFNWVVFGLKGQVENRLDLIYDTLMATSFDEPATDYGLVAEAVRYPDDLSSVTYRLR